MLVKVDQIKVPEENLRRGWKSKKIKSYIDFYNSNQCLPPLVLNELYEIKSGYTKYRAALMLGVQELNCDICQKRKSISKTKRQSIFAECGGCCKICGKPLQNANPADKETYMTIDHIIPLIKGGSNLLDNLQGMCLDCNVNKSGMLMDEFEKLITKIS